MVTILYQSLIQEVPKSFMPMVALAGGDIIYGEFDLKAPPIIQKEAIDSGKGWAKLSGIVTSIRRGLHFY